MGVVVAVISWASASLTPVPGSSGGGGALSLLFFCRTAERRCALRYTAASCPCASFAVDRGGWYRLQSER